MMSLRAPATSAVTRILPMSDVFRRGRAAPSRATQPGSVTSSPPPRPSQPPPRGRASLERNVAAKTSTSPPRGHPRCTVSPRSAPGLHPEPHAARRRRHSSVQDRQLGSLPPLAPRVAPHRSRRSSSLASRSSVFVVSSHAVATAGWGADREQMRSFLTPIGSGFALLTPSCFHTVARGSMLFLRSSRGSLPGCRPVNGLDELGHLASRRLGKSSDPAPHWVAAPTVTPVLSTNVCKLTICVSKNGCPAVSVHSPARSLRGESPRFHAEGSLRRAGGSSVSVSALTRPHVRTSDDSSSLPRASLPPHAACTAHSRTGAQGRGPALERPTR